MKNYNMSCTMPYGIPYMSNMNFNREGFNNFICLIEKAIEKENYNIMEYNYLCCKASSKSQRDLISSIRCDKINNRRYLKEIYTAYTGKCVDDDCCECCDKFKKPRSYKDGIRKAILRELKSVEEYRLIRENMVDRRYRELIFKMLTDAIKHSIEFNYILTELCYRKKKYKCRGIDDLYEDEEDISEDIEDNIYEDAYDAGSTFDNEELMRNINPLIDRALEEEDMGVNSRYLFSKFILSGALVGKGEEAENALNKVEHWQEDEEAGIFVRNNM